MKPSIGQFLSLNDMKVHILAGWTEVYHFYMLFMKTLLRKAGVEDDIVEGS